MPHHRPANGDLTRAGVNTYTWNERNQLATVKDANTGTTLASFVYGPFGRRIQNSAGDQMLYDGQNEVQEHSGSAPVVNRLTGSVDESFARTDSAGTTFPLTDALGSALALTDSSGTVQTQYTYDPFGGSTSSGAMSTNTYQFTGRVNDGTGLYYYRARYYSPRFQRFISEDPAGFKGSGPNLYAYVGDNPIDSYDPYGLSSLVYDGGTATITLYSGNDFNGTVIAQDLAYNNVVSGASHFPVGIHTADQWHLYNAGDSNSPFGTYGNLTFDVTGHTGMSVHSGRANKGGPMAKTRGCIRTTDQFMQRMYDTQFSDFNPVRRIMVTSPFEGPKPPGWRPLPAFYPRGRGYPPPPFDPLSGLGIPGHN